MSTWWIMHRAHHQSLSRIVLTPDQLHLGNILSLSILVTGFL